MASSGPGAEPEAYYTPSQAARILSRSGTRIGERRVRQMCAAGEIEASRESGGWKIPCREVHRLLEDRREVLEREHELEGPEAGPDSPESAAALLERLLDAERRAARSEAQLELTAEPQSTLREQLERELEALWAAETARPWWRRWFGG